MSPNPTSAEGQMIPCSQHQIDESDEQAVLRALRSGILTMGPEVEALEREFAAYVGARHAIAVSSGTAALHAAVVALGLPPGSGIAVPAITFVATAHAIVAAGQCPLFCDVDAIHLLLDPRIPSGFARAIVAVDFAGQPAGYELLRATGVPVIADAAHALGAREADGRMVGTLADLTCFSLHPSKLITAAEGGVVTTDNDEYATRVRRFRLHGRDYAGADARVWDYGLNLRLSELHAALARSQLARAEQFLSTRERLAAVYDEEFVGHERVLPLRAKVGVRHAWHLYVVRVTGIAPSVRVELQRRQIGVTLHYFPVHREPAYASVHRDLPVAQSVRGNYLTLPLHCGLAPDDVRRIARVVKEVVA